MLAFEVAETALNKSSHLYEGERNKREWGVAIKRTASYVKASCENFTIPSSNRTHSAHTASNKRVAVMWGN